MRQHTVVGRFDVWAGLWRVKHSSLPNLQIEAPTAVDFTEAATQACQISMGEVDHRIKVVCKKPVLWCITPPFSRRVLLNGRLLTRAQAEVLHARYAAAG